MIFRLLMILYLASTINPLNSQSYSLCNLHDSNDLEYYTTLEDYENNKEAVAYIEKLLNTVKLPMNFQVRQCKQKSCRNNASAKMDDNGTRFIIYDNDWFNSIDSDSTKVKSLTIFAHELGHHLSAHTLFINEANHEEAINYCDKRSNNYDHKKCNGTVKSTYQNYLYNSRKQELQADRFAGYIMSKYGINLIDIQATYKSIMKDYDDSYSSHPTLSKRLIALKEGYNLALKNRSNVDLFEIKGNPINIEVKDTTLLAELQNQKVADDIRDKLNNCIYPAPLRKITNSSKLEVSAGFGSYPDGKTSNRIEAYLGNDYNEIDKNNLIKNGEIFKYFDFRIMLKHNQNISFSGHPSYHIKDGKLKIILFNEEEPRIIYKSNFTKKDISFKEIEALLVEVYDNGLHQAILDYESKN